MDPTTSQKFKIKPLALSTELSWQVENFNVICPEGAKEFPMIKSPMFTVGADIGKSSMWFVSINGEDQHVNCYLELSESKNSNKILPIHCSFKIGFGNTVNPFFRKFQLDCTVTEEDLVCACKLIKISDLYQRKNMLLQDNSLRICIQMTLYGDLSIEGRTVFVMKDSEKNCVSDFHSLFQSKSFSDVEIMCEKKIFYCHKLILSVRSQVFRAMFSQPMIEANSNKVTIEDMTSPVMTTLLKYIYTGKIDLPSDGSVKLTEVIYGAEKYQLTELKNCCFNKMLEVMSDDTVGELVEASQLYNADKEVKKVIKTYVKGRLYPL